MNSQEIISIYETVAMITKQMVAAARTGDWDQLVELESRYASHVALLTNDKPRTALSGVVRDQKVQIIKKILEDDREIRNLTEPWMAQLSVLINSTGTEHKLSKTYGAHQSG